MSLYVTEKVNGQVVKKKYAPAVSVYRGFWAIVISGFAGTLVVCNGSSHYIGSNEKTLYLLTDPGTYSIIATRKGQTITKTIILDDKDPNNSYVVNVGMYIGMQMVEYVESDGNQYIDTGFVPNQDTRVILDAQLTGDSSQYGLFFGTENSASSKIFQIQCTSTGLWAMGYNNNAGAVAGTQWDNQRHTFEKNKNVQKIDGTTILTITAGTFTCDATALIFAGRITSTSLITIVPSKVYSCKIWDNGTLVRDFVPIKDDTGYGALYDKVSQQIYYNSGEGNLSAGPAKPYTRIQYLESTGTQYIDTGIVPTTSTEVKIKAAYTRIIPGNQYDSVIGSVYGSGGVYRFYPMGYTSESNKIRQSYGTSQWTQNYDTDIHEVDFNTFDKKVIVDETVVASNITGFTQDENQPTMYLFATHRSSIGGPDWFGAVRLYSCKIYDDNGDLVRNFIPILDTEGVPCLYDKVNDRLYYNEGTGNFIVGPTYETLEYIQSSGTQTINTGVIGNLDTSYEITWANDENITSGSAVIFGSRTTATQDAIMTSLAISGTTLYMLNDFGDYTVTRQQVRTMTSYKYNKFTTTNSKSERTIYNWGTGNTETVDTEYYQTFTTPTTLRICDASVMGGLANAHNFIGKIYRCKIWDNGTLVRDFVPVRCHNSIGLYDYVTETFFDNAGTGTFTPGPVIN